jgi:hypothetical protein
VQFDSRRSTSELLTYFCYIFTIIDVVVFTICFSLQEKYKEQVVTLTIRQSMPMEAKKHMDNEIDALFCLTL